MGENTTFEYLGYIAISVSLILLGYASWSDWRTREVTNYVWLVLAPVGAVLTFLRIFLLQAPVLYAVWALIVGLVAVISIALFYFGFWGGADFKAFVTLSLLFPWSPSAITPLLTVQMPFFPFTILINTLFLSMSVVIYVLAKNIAWKVPNRRSLFEGFENESTPRKILALLVGYKVKKEKLGGQHHFFLAESHPTGDGEGPKHCFKIQTEECNSVSLEELPAEVWVTPQLPMMIFLTLGTATALFLGDFLLWLLMNIHL